MKTIIQDRILKKLCKKGLFIRRDFDNGDNTYKMGTWYKIEGIIITEKEYKYLKKLKHLEDKNENKTFHATAIRTFK